MRELLKRSGALFLGLALVFPPSASKPPIEERMAVNQLVDKDEQPDPSVFSPEELQLLQQRFGVHGPQTTLAQLFTRGVDQLQPLRDLTLDQLKQLKPVIVRASHQQRINPMLVTAILFDEIQHSKPGESLPFIAHSGLVKTHGPAQLAITELIHQGLLPAHPNADEIAWARNQLLDPQKSVVLLVGKMSRLKQELGISTDRRLDASSSYSDAKAIATLAYLHNGKLDYPKRILSYMQDPELHGLIYSSKRSQPFVLL